MYFNIPEQLIKKYENSYPDLLLESAKVFNDFEDEFKDEDMILLYYNQHLKLFPIVDRWRTELFYQWDVCRQSLICAASVVKELNFKADDISNERIYKELLAEYYLDNSSFRIFSILDKIGHPLNQFFNLGLTDRKVSYYNVKKEIISKDLAEFEKLFLDFEKEDNLLAEFKEYRNSLTHRNHLLQPSLELDDIEIDLGENNENGLNGIIKVNTVKKTESKLSITKLFTVVEEIYNRLTIFLRQIFLNLLKEIKERYENEAEEFE